MEDRVGTNKNNSDTDGDGVLDAEDQLPLDPNYSLDNDQDGLPDELDPMMIIGIVIMTVFQMERMLILQIQTNAGIVMEME